ncbi:hypothetical protein B0J15DRAFT_506428 [Fusarium solani]|uniref:Secreted protein n=1 Tax=Fusarium solani TaxID=169388 RepID=A0A9P9G0J3_FUSSL|nr:uncharacterized protein B0J15DRAFT_506428 [Fusarium solani]KAH7230296.1 hypothetical protein B0J15DRAFT_506428 [Fusarium solani]
MLLSKFIKHLMLPLLCRCIFASMSTSVAWSAWHASSIFYYRSASSLSVILLNCHRPDKINSRGNTTVLRGYYDGEERENAGRRVDA